MPLDVGLCFSATVPLGYMMDAMCVGCFSGVGGPFQMPGGSIVGDLTTFKLWLKK